MDGWNTSFLLGWPIFRGYVSFREGNLLLWFLGCVSFPSTIWHLLWLGLVERPPLGPLPIYKVRSRRSPANTNTTHNFPLALCFGCKFQDATKIILWVLDSFRVNKYICCFKMSFISTKQSIEEWIEAKSMILFPDLIGDQTNHHNPPW